MPRSTLFHRFALALALLFSSVGAEQGIDYLYHEFFDGLWFSPVHILVVDPSLHEISPARAVPGTPQTETVLEMATHHKAYAAINAGFFHSDGSPAGILKHFSQFEGLPTKPRGAVAWNQGALLFMVDRLLTTFSEDGAVSVLAQSELSEEELKQWQVVDHIIGGTPLLIRHGKRVTDFSVERTIESFLHNRHPRTAIGMRDDGKWIFLVCDGRFYGSFGGMTIPELAKFMEDLGCVEALNLDGGGSTTMVLDGEVVNEPCGEVLEGDKWVRSVSDVILIHSSKQTH